MSDDLFIDSPKLTHSDNSGSQDPLSVSNAKRNQKVQERDAESDKKHQETITKANADIENFYKKRAEEKERKKAMNLDAEAKQRIATDTRVDNVWAKATEYVDFKTSNAAARDTSRLRKLMIDLKNTK